MSRITYLDENNEIKKEIIYRIDECRYKVNGICYNNNGDYIRLGKRCHYCKNTCTYFLIEEQ